MFRVSIIPEVLKKNGTTHHRNRCISGILVYAGLNGNLPRPTAATPIFGGIWVTARQGRGTLLLRGAIKQNSPQFRRGDEKRGV